MVIVQVYCSKNIDLSAYVFMYMFKVILEYLCVNHNVFNDY